MAEISAAARQKKIGAALLHATTQYTTFANMLTGEVTAAPQGNEGKVKMQTDAGSPVIRVQDLKQGEGDTISVDMEAKLVGEPTMGSDDTDGRAESMIITSDTVKIDQTRHLVKDGGKMKQQMTQHKLKVMAKNLLKGYFARLDDERVLYHLAGARGDHFIAGDTIIHPQSPKLAKILINELTPPTHHYFGGDAQNLADIDSSDLFTLSKCLDVWHDMRSAGSPIEHIQLRNKDGKEQCDPFYVMEVTPSQWFDIKTSTAHAEWAKLAASVSTRMKGFSHPILNGECIMHENMLIRPMRSRIVKFNVGTTVNTIESGLAQTRTAGVQVHRAIVLGAQAIAVCYGGSTKSGQSFFWSDEEKDHGDKNELLIGQMGGVKKLRFKDEHANLYRDQGVMCIDTAVTRPV